MLHDLFTIGINGKTSEGLNTSASNCMCIPSQTHKEAKFNLVNPLAGYKLAGANFIHC